MNSAEQFGRVCKLIVGDRAGNGLDLSAFHIKFNIKRSDTVTPNTADILVENLSQDTALLIKKEYTKVILQAGYEGNFGVIFQGNIKQIIIGRSSGTETFLNIIAGDGDQAYNFALVNKTISSGASALDQVNAAIASMSEKGTTQGHLGEFPTEVLPRGKVMYGNAREYLTNVAQTTDKVWSIQDEKVTFIGKNTYLPGERVVITSKTGMIGSPQQTNEGVNVKTLLNPMIRIGTRVQLDNASIQALKINLSVPNSAANIPAPLTADGTYYVLVAEHEGDNRGVPWYTSLVCLNVDITTNPLNSVSVNGG